MNEKINAGTELAPGAVVEFAPTEAARPAAKPAESTAAGGRDNEPTQTGDATSDGASGVYVHRFKRPFEYEGKTYKTLNFYFERLKGRDMEAIEREMQHTGENTYVPETSKSYQCKLAARAANIGADVLEGMPIGDFNRITNEARAFLLETGY